MDLSELIQGFVRNETRILFYRFVNIDKCLSLNFYMDLPFVLCISCPLPNKNKLRFHQDFKAFWSFCFELNSMSWVWLNSYALVLHGFHIIFIELYFSILIFLMTGTFCCYFYPRDIQRMASRTPSPNCRTISSWGVFITRSQDIFTFHTLTHTSLRGRYSNLSSQTSDFTKSSLQDLKT